MEKLGVYKEKKLVGSTLGPSKRSCEYDTSLACNLLFEACVCLCFISPIRLELLTRKKINTNANTTHVYFSAITVESSSSKLTEERLLTLEKCIDTSAEK